MFVLLFTRKATMMITTFLFMPVYFYLMEKYGKRTTYLIGVLVRA